MKILGLEEFLKLPSGTVFHHLGKPEEMHADEMFIKGETIGTDFYEIQVGFEPTEDFDDWRLCDEWCRWGLFEKDARFLVFDPQEVLKIIGQLSGLVLCET